MGDVEGLARQTLCNAGEFNSFHAEPIWRSVMLSNVSSPHYEAYEHLLKLPSSSVPMRP